MPKSLPAIVRFMRKVDMGPSGCWMWTGHVNADGYGRFTRGPRAGLVLCHRFSYEQAVGKVPDGSQLDHLCRNRACVRPSHLEAVTHRENMRRGAVHWPRKEHCPSGHPYTPENTGHSRGRRYCRTCHRAQYRAWQRNPANRDKISARNARAYQRRKVRRTANDERAEA